MPIPAKIRRRENSIRSLGPVWFSDDNVNRWECAEKKGHVNVFPIDNLMYGVLRAVANLNLFQFYAHQRHLFGYLLGALEQNRNISRRLTPRCD